MIKKLSIIVIFVAYLALPGKILAKDTGLTVSPSVLQIVANPAQMLEEILSITNTSDHAIGLTPGFIPITSMGDAAKAQLLNDEKTKSFYAPLFSSVVFKEDRNIVKTITLAPGVTKKIRTSFTAPDYLDRSDYYFSILFISSTPEAIAQNTTEIQTKTFLQPAVGIVVLVTNPQTNQLPPALSLQAQKISLFTPLKLTTVIHNSGKGFIQINGSYEIKWFQKLLSRSPFSETIILSHTSRALTTSLKLPLFLPGIYSVTTQVNLKHASLSTKATVRFVYVPIVPICSVIGLFVLLFFIKNRLHDDRS